MREKVSLINNNKIPLNVSVVRFDTIFRHIHAHPQILLVLEGDCDIYIGDEMFHALQEDIIIVNANIFHHLVSKRNCTVVSAILDLAGFGLTEEEILSLSFDLNTIKEKDNPRYDQMRYLIYSLIKYNTMENFNSVYTNRAISFSFFAQLINDFGVMKPINENTNTILKIEGYMNDNYKDKLTLNDIANHFNYTVPYLSRLFKAQTGKNFGTLYDALRINYSFNDLLQTNKNIEEIAANNGFENARSYVRAFKSMYDINPSDYRKRFIIKKSEPPFVDHKLLKKNALDRILSRYDSFGHIKEKNTSDQIRNFDIVANVNLKNIEFHLSSLGSDIIEIKSIFDLFNEDTYNLLKQAKKDINYKYILVPNILAKKAYILSRNDENTWTLNFVIFEKMLNKILDLGVKPYLILEYDRSLLTFKEYYTIILQIFEYTKLNFYKKIKDGMICFSNYRKSLVKEHYVIEEDFFNLYLKLYKDLRNNFKHIKIGSPLFYKEDILKNNDYFHFLKLAKQNDLEFDFIPIRYTIRDHNSSLLSKDKDEFKHFIDYLKENNAFFEGKMSFQGINFTNNQSLLNDCLYSSSYYIKNYMDNLKDIVGYSKRTFIDQTMLSAYDKNPYHGDCGMFTYNGLKKASYNAYVFLSKLEKNVICQNKHYLVTASNDKIVILINNYNHYSDLFAEHEYFEINNLNRYICFPKSTKVNFHFNIENVMSQSVQIKTSIINTNSGSSYDKWISMGANKILDNDEIDVLQNLSVINYHYDRAYTKNNILSLDISVLPLESKLIEIIMD